jgi:hypothetical protein
MMAWLAAGIVGSSFGFPSGEPPQLQAATIAPLQAAMEANLRADHEALLRAFFAAIDDARVDDAIAMLQPDLVLGADRGGWQSQFEAIISIIVTDMQPVDDLTGPCYDYRVTLQAEMSPQSADEPVPYFGWGENPNIRWISMCPGEGRPWQISSIGTGP